MINTIKRASAVLLAVIMIAVSLAPFQVDAYEDDIAPVVNSFKILGGDKQEDGTIKVKSGEYFDVEVDLTEEHTGVRQISFHVNEVNMGRSMIIKAYLSNLPTLYTGVYTLRFRIPYDAITGQYRITSVYIDDNAFNYEPIYISKDDPDGNIIFDISGKEDESPVLEDIQVSKSSELKAGDTVSYQLVGKKFDRIDQVRLVLDAVDADQDDIVIEKNLEKKADSYSFSFDVTAEMVGYSWDIYQIGLICSSESSYYSFTNFPYVGEDGKWVKLRSLKGSHGNDDWVSIVDKTTFKVGEAAEEVPLPVLKGITSAGIVSRPGVITIAIDATSTIGIKAASVTISSVTDKSARGRKTELATPIKNGTIYVDIPIESTDRLGDWYVSNLSLTEVNNRTHNLSSWESNDYNLVYYKAPFGVITEVFDTGINHWLKVTDDIDYDIELGLSNPKLVELINKLEEGSIVRIPITSNESVLKAEVFDAIRAKDITLICYDTDRNYAYQWVINGLDINKASKDVDLRVVYSKLPGSDIKQKKDYMKFDFAPNGELPGKATIRFKNDYIYKQLGGGTTYHLYYIDELGEYTDIIEQDTLVMNEIDDQDKWCTFEVTHNSLYILANGKPKATITSSNVTGVNSSYLYSGEYIRPTVRVSITYKLGTKKYNAILRNATDYTVSYSKNKSVGKAAITIKGKGSYGGTAKKYFSIIPKGTSLTGLTGVKKGFKAYWNKQSTMTNGYQLQYSTSSSMSKAKTKTISKSTTTNKSVGSLSRNKTYYVRIRTYKTVSGKKYYSSWSGVEAVTTI